MEPTEPCAVCGMNLSTSDLNTKRMTFTNGKGEELRSIETLLCPHCLAQDAEYIRA